MQTGQTPNKQKEKEKNPANDKQTLLPGQFATQAFSLQMPIYDTCKDICIDDGKTWTGIKFHPSFSQTEAIFHIALLPFPHSPLTEVHYGVM